tara:strand:+ start:21 stop:572 length:552 start_codon:yes stop_codon:yes gene_type:complete
MNNYIQIYKNVISDEYCDELVNKFESNTDQYDTYEKNSMSFTQINLNQNDWIVDISKLSQVFTKYVEQYKKDCNIVSQMWPDTYNFEEFRLKRYLPNDRDQFKPHVDASNFQNAIRFLVFFIYLNDNHKGETAFPQLEVASPCKKGSLLMFPPLWPWLHAGLKPVNKPKYMIGSYLHYRKNNE